MTIKDIFNPAPDVGGLEISDFALRFARITAAGAIKQVSVQLPPGIVIGGKIQDKLKLLTALRGLHRQILPLKKPVHVVLLLSAGSVATQSFSMPLVAEKNLKETAELNLQSVSPIDIRTAYYGYSVFGETKPGQVEGLGAFVPIAEVESWLSVLKESNFKTVAVEFPAFSLTRLIKEYGANLAPGTPYLIIHLLADGPDMMIIKDGNLYFNYFNSWKSLQDELTGRKIENKDIQDFIIGHLKQILNFYGARWGVSITKAMVVNSPVANEIMKTAKESFGLDTQLLTVGKFSQVSPIWYSALGAAVRGRIPRSEDKLLSLMAVGAQEDFYRGLTLDFIKSWRNIIAIVLTLVFGVFAVANVLLSRASADLEKDLSARNLTPLAEIQALQAGAQKFNQAVDFALAAQEVSVPWSPLLLKIQSLAGAKVSIDRLYVDQSMSALIVGKADTDSAVITFKNAIDKEENFKDVILPLSNIKVGQDGSVSFSLNFKVVSLKF